MKRQVTIVLLTSLLVFTMACKIFGKKNKSAVLDESTQDSYRHLTDDSHYYASNQGDYGDFDSYIKFSFIFDEQGRLGKPYFQNKSLKFHHDFLSTRPEFRNMTPQEIDQNVMHDEGRKGIIGSILVRSPESFTDQSYYYAVQIISESIVKPETVREVLDAIQEVSGEFFKLKGYLPYSTQKEFVTGNLHQFADQNIDIVRITDNRESICYSVGWAVGRVVRAKASKVNSLYKKGKIGPTDIVIMDEAPRELPIIGGAVISTVTAPSSHAALLSRMSGSPLIFQKGAFNSDLWKNLAEAKANVFLKVKGSGPFCELVLVNSDKFGEGDFEFLQGLKLPEPLTPATPDLSTNNVVDLASMHRFDVGQIGAKAANFSTLMKVIPNSSLDRAAALPLSMYLSFVENAEVVTDRGSRILKDVIQIHLNSIEDPRTPMRVIDWHLKEIRKVIKGAELPPQLRQNILTGIANLYPRGTRLRLRSSSNIEDGLYFNGAGLYDSKGVCLGDDGSNSESSVCGDGRPDSLIEGVKSVWASLYKLRAFIARRKFFAKEEVPGTGEKLASMGVLVHRPFTGELANGVAVSFLKESYNGRERFSVESSSFPGDELSITNPTGDQQPEVALIGQDHTTIVTPTSERAAGRTVLNDQQYKTLYEKIKRVHENLLERYESNKRNVLEFDFEWKLTADNQIVIKQVRPVPLPQANGSKNTIVIGDRDLLLCPGDRDQGGDALKKLFFQRIFKTNFSMFKSTGLAGSVASPFDKLEVLLDSRSDLQQGYDLGPAHLATMRVREHNSRRTEQVTTQLNNLSNFEISFSLEVDSLADGTVKDSVRVLNEVFGPHFVSVSPVPSSDVNRRSVGASWNFNKVNGNSKEDCLRHLGIDRPEPDNSIFNDDQVSFIGRSTYRNGEQEINIQWTGDDITSGGCAEDGGIGAGCTFHRVIRKMRVDGILDRPLYIGTFDAVSSSVHHGYDNSLAADLYQAEGLTEGEKRSLQVRRIRYITFPVWSATTNETEIHGLDENLQNRKTLGTKEDGGGFINPLPFR